MQERRATLHKYLERKLVKGGIRLGGIDPALKFEVHSLRPSIRLDWEGKPNFQWIIELTQRVAQWFDGEAKQGAPPDYYFRGGCTLVVDARSGEVRYSIKKRLSDARKERQRRYFIDTGNRSLAATYFGGVGEEEPEPFALLHRR
jgi:hypothetical protein